MLSIFGESRTANSHWRTRKKIINALIRINSWERKRLAVPVIILQHTPSSNEDPILIMTWYLRYRQLNCWQVESLGCSNFKRRCCHISLEQLCQTTLLDRRESQLLEPILTSLLRINCVTPLGLSQQHKTPQDLPDKIFNVEECWNSYFYFRVAASNRA